MYILQFTKKYILIFDKTNGKVLILRLIQKESPYSTEQGLLI